jgi:peptidyl-prolyl cis-trans isomerase C
VTNYSTQSLGFKNSTLITILILVWLLTACQSTPTPFNVSGSTAPSPTGEVTNFPDTTRSPTVPNPPTNTPIPLALSVNEEGITLAEYEAAITRFLLAQPAYSADEARTRVLEEFIDQLLLSQAATQNGYIVDKTLLEERIISLANQIGGIAQLNEWISANGYTEEFFQLELRRSIAAAWMRDQIIGAVPDKMEQVRARQLLLFNSTEAADVYRQLQNGVTFEVMLAYYDPIGLGDLGWFPRGYLAETAIEEAAFALEPGNYSTVIETHLGFHIIQLIERQMDRPIDPDARLVLREKALDQWLENKRLESDLVILIP